MLRKQEVSYVGTSVASAEEWHLRQKFQGIARDVFGDGVRIKNGQIIRFRDTAARILTNAGWKPAGTARMMQAGHILREHAEELASLVEITKANLPTESMRTVKEGH
ncbi:MAG: hypothetical protein HZB51_22540 [Chloroflexi bacterium]|nr:hypothetical protein [Chloroflexota bacterium]